MGVISLEPRHLMEEIRDAEKKRDAVLTHVNEIMQAIAGNYWRTDVTNPQPTPENYAWAFLTFAVPQLVYEVPSANVSSTSAVTGGEVAEDLSLALNSWMKEVEIKPLLQEMAQDILTGYGMTMVGLESRGDYAGEGYSAVGGEFPLLPLYPYALRIPRRNVILDAHCTNVKNARIMGRRFKRDLDDVMQDERYRPEAVQTLTHMHDDQRTMDAFPRAEEPGTDRRRSVTLYEVYLPEHKRLVTLVEKGNGVDGVIVRDEVYYGPDEGPFDLWGAYFLADEPWPLSPIAAVYEQFKELNDHAAKNAEDAAVAKRIGLVDANDGELDKKLANAKSGDLIKAKNLGAVLNLDLGGASQFSMQYVLELRDRLDRMMGFTPAQQGKAEKVTATAANISQTNSDIRMEHLRQRMRDLFQSVLRKVLWYFWYESSIVFPATKVDPITGAATEGMFLGGVQPGQERYDPADFGITIDPQSMVKVDDALQQKRAQDLLALSIQLAQIVPMTPWMNWTYLVDTVGDSLNIKRLSERMFTSPPGMMGQAMMAPGSPQAAQMGIGPTISASPRMGGVNPAAMMGSLAATPPLS